MSRLRYNDLRATLGGSLTNSATSVTFGAALTHSNGTSVPTIAAGDYIPLTILDSSGNLSEIVWLTAYTSGATTGTIGRGKEGTTGVSHASGDKVVQSPTVDDVRFIGCAAERTTNQSVASASWTTVQFDATDIYDTDSIHDPSTNNTRLTVPAGRGGYWRFTATVEFANNTNGVRVLAWGKNGTQLANRYGNVYRSPAPMYTTVITSTLDLFLADGDYIDVRVYQETGLSINLASAYVTCQLIG